MKIVGYFAVTLMSAVWISIAAMPAAAHMGANGVVKMRMALMGEIAARTKFVGSMMRGRIEFDADAVQKTARIIAEHAAVVTDHFPEGSLAAPSEALPDIWADWETFVKLANDLHDSANELSAAAHLATDPADLTREFKAMAGSCIACHESFRQRK